MNERQQRFDRNRILHALRNCQLSPDEGRTVLMNSVESDPIFDKVQTIICNTSPISLLNAEDALVHIHTWLTYAKGEVAFWWYGCAALGTGPDFANALPLFIQYTNTNCVFTSRDGAAGASLLKREHDFAVRMWK